VRFVLTAAGSGSWVQASYQVEVVPPVFDVFSASLPDGYQLWWGLLNQAANRR